MRVLAIETASEACSVALFDDGRMIAHDHRVLGRGHAEALVPMIAELPGKGRADRILVTLGPGSFTGVRIGLATARALGFAWGAEVLGYSTLALIAAQTQAAHLAQAVTVCTNGGHGEWFIADFGADGFPQANAASFTPAAAQTRRCHALIAGNRAAEFITARAGERLTAIPLLPDSAAIGLLPEAVLTSALAPIYGRGPDATPLAEQGRA